MGHDCMTLQILDTDIFQVAQRSPAMEVMHCVESRSSIWGDQYCCIGTVQLSSIRPLSNRSRGAPEFYAHPQNLLETRIVFY
eukprot:6490080-Amphidinium_carterae.1